MTVEAAAGEPSCLSEIASSAALNVLASRNLASGTECVSIQRTTLGVGGSVVPREAALKDQE